MIVNIINVVKPARLIAGRLTARAQMIEYIINELILCCSDDLLNSAIDLLDRPEPPEYLLIEASGVSDPWAVAETFDLPELRPYFTLDGVIAVVDAEYVWQNQHYEELIVDQVCAADIVVLSKVDLVDEEQRASVEAWVRQIVPRARILPAVHGEVPINFLLGVGRYQLELTPLRAPGHAHAQHHDDHHEHGLDCDHDHQRPHDHGVAFSSWSYTSTYPPGLKALRKVALDLPAAIFRAKGLIYLAEAPTRRVIFQMVGKRVNVVIGEPWGEEPPCTQLVFLSTPGGLDGAALQVAFDGCRTGLSLVQAISTQQTWMRGGRRERGRQRGRTACYVPIRRTAGWMALRAKRRNLHSKHRDCVVADAPRNDRGHRGFRIGCAIQARIVCPWSVSVMVAIAETRREGESALSCPGATPERRTLCWPNTPPAQLLDICRRAVA